MIQSLLDDFYFVSISRSDRLNFYFKVSQFQVEKL